VVRARLGGGADRLPRAGHRPWRRTPRRWSSIR
jgi:hypothetical protein